MEDVTAQQREVEQSNTDQQLREFEAVLEDLHTEERTFEEAKAVVNPLAKELSTPINRALLNLFGEIFLVADSPEYPSGVPSHHLQSYQILSLLPMQLQSKGATATLTSPKNITGRIAQLKYCVRAMTLAICAVQASEEHTTVQHQLKSKYHRFLTSADETAYSEMSSLSAKATVSILDTQPCPNLRWDEVGFTGTFKGNPFDTRRIGLWVTNILPAQAATLLKQDLLFGIDFNRLHVKIPVLESVSDNIDDHSPGASFLDHAENKPLLLFDGMLLHSLPSDHPLFAMFPAEGRVFDRAAAVAFLCKCWDFEKCFYLNLLICSGPPKRTTEMCSATIRNPSACTVRSLVIDFGRIAVLTTYNKSNRAKGSTSPNDHFFDKLHSNLLFIYLLVVRPLMVTIALEIYGEKVANAFRTMLWTSSHGPLIPSIAREYVNGSFRQHLPEFSITVNSQRHIAIALFRQILATRLPALVLEDNFDVPTEAENKLEHAARLLNLRKDETMDLMAGHGTATAESTYAVSHGREVGRSRTGRFGIMSTTRWSDQRAISDEGYRFFSETCSFPTLTKKQLLGSPIDALQAAPRTTEFDPQQMVNDVVQGKVEPNLMGVPAAEAMHFLVGCCLDAAKDFFSSAQKEKPSYSRPFGEYSSTMVQCLLISR